MSLSTFCLNCGEPTKPGPRCDDCRKRDGRRRIRKHSRKASSTDRGYDERWRRLSERARRLQPFCSDCGATTDLQADHSPEAWRRWEKGLPLRLKDVDVTCGSCNRERGAARGDKRRSKASEVSHGPGPHKDDERPSPGDLDTLGEDPKPIPPRPRPFATLRAIDYPMANYETERRNL